MDGSQYLKKKKQQIQDIPTDIKWEENDMYKKLHQYTLNLWNYLLWVLWCKGETKGTQVKSSNKSKNAKFKNRTMFSLFVFGWVNGQVNSISCI